MRTLKKDGRTLQPEDIYLDLSKLSEEEIKNISKILEDAGEILSYYPPKKPYDAILAIDNVGNWGYFLLLSGRTEITYPEFLQLFGESELTEKVLPEITLLEMKKGLEQNGYFVSEYEVTESNKKTIKSLKDKIYDFEKNSKEQDNRFFNLKSQQIAQLRAVQMMLSAMKKGSTHRQKELFSDLISTMLDEEIEKLKSKESIFHELENLPF